jgi:hypothetical protein
MLYAIDIGGSLLEVLDTATLAILLFSHPLAVVPLGPGFKLLRSALCAASPQAVINVDLMTRRIFARLTDVLRPIVNPCRLEEAPPSLRNRVATGLSDVRFRYVALLF